MRFADTRSSFVFEPLAIAANTSRCSSLDAAHMNLGDIKGTAFSCRIHKSILNIDSHLARYRPARIRLSPARALNFSDLVAAVASSAGHGTQRRVEALYGSLSASQGGSRWTTIFNSPFQAVS